MRDPEVLTLFIWHAGFELMARLLGGNGSPGAGKAGLTMIGL